MTITDQQDEVWTRQQMAAVGTCNVLRKAVDEFMDRIDNLAPGRKPRRHPDPGPALDTPAHLAEEMTDTLAGWVSSVCKELGLLEQLDEQRRPRAAG